MINNVFLFLSVSIFFGAIACFLITKLILAILKVVRPTWIGLEEVDFIYTPPPKTKLVPRRLPASYEEKPSGSSKQKFKLLTGAAIFSSIFLFSILNSIQSPTCPPAASFMKVSPKPPPYMDGVRMKFWPVWGRTGNDNIISREKIFGQEFVSKEPVLDAIPEELWPLLVRTGNEWLIKRRMPIFRNNT
jgi:hypothetical protein